MRKVIFNIVSFLEHILNVELICCILLVTSAFSAICAYDTDTANSYGNILNSINRYVNQFILIILIINIVATVIKIIINYIKAGNKSKIIKVMFLPIIICTFIWFKEDLTNIIVNKFDITGEYQLILINQLYYFWLFLITIVLKNIIGTSNGFIEINKFTLSNEIALKYFNGSFSDLDMNMCNNIAIKYEGDI